MEMDALKNALIDLIVEVVKEVKNRTMPIAETRTRAIPDNDLENLETRPPMSQSPLQAMPRFVSTKQAASYWGTSTVGFRRMLDRLFPELPKGIVVRVGKRVRVDIRAFESWLVSKEIGPRRRP
jgi:hypothetical protein